MPFHLTLLIFLNLSGDIPEISLKTLPKCVELSYPVFPAILLTFRSDSFKRRFLAERPQQIMLQPFFLCRDSTLA